MRLTIEVDNAAVLAALDTLGDAAEPYVDRASETTANRIALEARSRVRRRTGKTQEGIVVERSHFGTGYAVVSGNPRMPNLPIWLEHGTKRMPEFPFFHPAVELERDAHWHRIAEAVQQAIDEKGLGD